jgi:hypothetical protein
MERFIDTIYSVLDKDPSRALYILDREKVKYVILSIFFFLANLIFEEKKV